jgi:hypothetical protein
MTTNWVSKPAENPDSGQLRDAVQKGLGRALLWARQGLWQDKDILLNACLHDLRYDRQCEEARGPWLWGLMEAASLTNQFREAILATLPTVDNGLAGKQLCQFCVLYARGGDDRFRYGLQEIVTRKPDPTYPSLGEAELIDLDGEAGFAFAARLRAQSLAHREWDWDDALLFDVAAEKLGKLAVVALIDRESESSATMSHLCDEWRKADEKNGAEPRQKHVDRMRQYSVDDIIHAAEVTRKQPGLFRGWGMYAHEADLRVILVRLLNSEDAVVLENYLRVFSNRPLPEFDVRILRLVDHEDENVRNRVFTALANNAHPSIRSFAVEQVQRRIDEFGFLELFIRNFQSGDEELLIKNIRIPGDVNRRHWLLMALTKVLEQNSECQCSELAVLAYGCTPCGSCRFHSAKLLITRKVAPAWLVNECPFDAVSDTRELVSEVHAKP